MPVYTLTPDWDFGLRQETVDIRARSARAAVVRWFGNDGETRVARFPNARGEFRCTPDIDPIDGGGTYLVRARPYRTSKKEAAQAKRLGHRYPAAEND